MIKSLSTTENRMPEPVRLADIDFPSPFYEGLQYNAPARGVWNIVHTGMLIPESHQVYVCAQGCLRGVILTAAEMNEMKRMSWVALRESDMWNGEMENRVIDGTSHIVDQLETKPRCVLIYLSCMHMFEGCDFKMITDELNLRYPDIDFVECYMIPTMRKTMSPDAMMKISLYESVKKLKRDDNLVAVIGNHLPIDPSSDLSQLIQMSGKKLWDITNFRTYDEYLNLGSSGTLVSFLSVADAGAKQLSERLDGNWIRVLLRFDEEKTDQGLLLLGETLGLKKDVINDWIKERKDSAYAALKKAHDIIGSCEIAIDYTAVPYILELSELLLKYGFNVKKIFADNFPADEKNSFERIIKDYPHQDIEVYPTNEPAMRFEASGRTDHKTTDGQISENALMNDPRILAIGQKAAYFTNTSYFVDIIEGGGAYGYQAIERLANDLVEAYLSPKDTKKLISHKGWGCESCL
ncbi:Nitrogenase component 1 type Oxidoreductase [Lachnospiraceae bacterium]|nr:Nitrogenase component 1 type Oxidoreductase [Lachnospiraceae bacterium]